MSEPSNNITPGNPARLRIGLVAGEKSGDLLGAGLIESLRQLAPNAEFSGLGGAAMQAQGFTSIADMELLSVMGLVEPLKRLPDLLRLRRDLLQHFLDWPADVVIGIDSPDFNLGLERRLRSAGLPTVHYVCPSVWAWRQGRVKKIRASADHVLALLPFEQSFLEQNGVASTFVGHPLADSLPPPEPIAANPEVKASRCLCVMPGSRMSEVSQLAGPFLLAAQQCLQRFDDLQVVIAAANETLAETLQQQLIEYSVESSRVEIRLCRQQAESLDCMREADVILLASGTATLEAGLLGKPMVVGYRLSTLTHAIAKRLVKADQFALPNLLLQSTVVPELIQHQANADQLALEVGELLASQSKRNAMREQLCGLHGMLARDASQRSAEAVLQVLAEAGSAKY